MAPTTGGEESAPSGSGATTSIDGAVFDTTDASTPCEADATGFASNGEVCTSLPPEAGAPCGSGAECHYCTPAGLVYAQCASIDDTFMWFASAVSTTAH